MVGFIWVFSSALFVMLIVRFLPLGITKKGKVILVFASFFISLGGLAATVSFSFSLTVLILFLLILFVTYLFDQRLGKWLYINDDSLEEQEKEDFNTVSAEEAAASYAPIYQTQKEKISEPINPIKVKEEQVPHFERTQSEASTESDALPIETVEEDISFLLNRSLLIEKERSNKIEEQNIEVDYLSEIEELLNNKDAIEKVEDSNIKQIQTLQAEDDYEIPVLSFEDKPLKKKNEADFKSSQLVDDPAEIPILPFHEKVGEQS